MPPSSPRNALLLTAFAAAGVLLAGCDGSDDGNTAAVEIRTLSNRADLVSGGDALLRSPCPQGRPWPA